VCSSDDDTYRVRRRSDNLLSGFRIDAA